MTSRFPIGPVILLFLLSLSLGFAQDDDLYPDPPPPDAAFVRILHANPGGGLAEPRIGSRTFPLLDYGAATDYFVVLQGDRQAEISDAISMLPILAGHFYTVVLAPADGGATIHAIDDTILGNRAKALLTLYNLSTRDAVDLKTGDGSVDVLLGVAPLQQAGIEVNAIAVDLGLFQDSERIELFEGIQLERGGVYSAVVLGTEEEPRFLWLLTRTVLD